MRTNLNGEQPANSAGSDIMPDKFKSGEQLLKAYEMLEAAFTRKSQKLKELLEENARLKGELMEKQPDLSGMIEDFKAYPEGAQYAPGLSAVLQSEPNLTPAGLLAALARVIRCECVPREQLLQDREFVEKYVLTNEDITEYILRKYLVTFLYIRYQSRLLTPFSCTSCTRQDGTVMNRHTLYHMIDLFY